MGTTSDAKITIPNSLFFNTTQETRDLVAFCREKPETNINQFVSFGENEIHVQACSDLNTEISRMNDNEFNNSMDWYSYYQDLCQAKPDAKFTFFASERAQYDGQSITKISIESCKGLEQFYAQETDQPSEQQIPTQTAGITGNIFKDIWTTLLRVISDE